MSLKELYALSHLFATANPWPLSPKQRQIIAGLMRDQNRTDPITLEQLKVVIELCAGTDGNALDAATWKTLYDLANTQSRAHGYDDWTEVYELGTERKAVWLM